MPPQPARESVGSARDFTIEADASRAGKIKLASAVNDGRGPFGWLRAGCPSLLNQGRNQSKINDSQISGTRSKFSPCLERIAHPQQAERPRKIISASGRDH